METLYQELKKLSSKPKAFEFYTAAELWTDEHTSKQMLACHLDPEIDLSSRKGAFIQSSVEWIRKYFKVDDGTRIADFGCGPGLYAHALAKVGAAVTGIDFSPRSIEYAKSQAAIQGLNISYRCQNYLEFETDEKFDLILMIFCDLCALSPSQRKILLTKFASLLNPGGRILLDVCAMAGFAERKEGYSIEENQLNGFWSPRHYYGFVNTFKYDDEKVMLDKYTIVEEERVRTVYNWLQYYSPESLKAEFNDCGLQIDALFGNVAGDPYNPENFEFAVTASPLR